MKYLRTKYSIFEWTGGWAYPDETVEDILNSVKALEVKQSPYLIRETEVIKESEEIIDLCDCYVSIISPMEPHIHEYFSDMIDWIDGDWDDAVCYGAIWTPKGLIYVAEMNKEGFMELL